MSEGNNLFQWTAMKPENVTLIREHGASLFRIHTPALRAIMIIVRDEKSPFTCLKKSLRWRQSKFTARKMEIPDSPKMPQKLLREFVMRFARFVQRALRFMVYVSNSDRSDVIDAICPRTWCWNTPTGDIPALSHPGYVVSQSIF